MPARQPVVIGVDIGGTKIKAGAVEVGPSGLVTRLIASQEIATPCAVPAVLYDVVAALVRDVRAKAERTGHRVLPLVAVAHPGRFLSDGRLARGTTPNLGAAPGEFDGLHPAQQLSQRLLATVIAENDAVAQMRFGVDVLLGEPAVRPHLLGQTVVYLGPGTGMGGGVAQVSLQGEVTTVTDGHFFDLQIPGFGDGTLTAEELLTGPAIARDIARRNAHRSSPILPATAEQLDRLLADPERSRAHGAPRAEPVVPSDPPVGRNPERAHGRRPWCESKDRAEAERMADAHGDILALLIETIHSGTIVKVRLEPTRDGHLLRHPDEPDRAWTAEDRAAVRGARRFLLGGSVGCSAGLGGRIRHRALEVLRHRGLADVMIFQIPVVSADAGLLGVVKGLPASELQGVLHGERVGPVQ